MIFVSSVFLLLDERVRQHYRDEGEGLIKMFRMLKCTLDFLCIDDEFVSFVLLNINMNKLTERWRTRECMNQSRCGKNWGDRGGGIFYGVIILWDISLY